ncbi:hypothetical protein [Streptomyces sp. NPDC002913]
MTQTANPSDEQPTRINLPVARTQQISESWDGARAALTFPRPPVDPKANES